MCACICATLGFELVHFIKPELLTGSKLMIDENSGLAIALQRIAQEESEQSGSLDLGQLGLPELPEVLFCLRHLRRLNLGRVFWSESGVRRGAASDIAPNDIAGSLDRLIELPQLEELSLSGTYLVSSENLAA